MVTSFIQRKFLYHPSKGEGPHDLPWCVS